MLDRLKKLDIGDITAYERRMKERRRTELIALSRELYGDNIPEGEAMRIDAELKKIPSIFAEGQTEIDADAVQFLLWRSMMKSDPDITFDSVGELMDTDNMMKYINAILPAPDKVPTKKKTAKKKARKKKPKDN